MKNYSIDSINHKSWSILWNNSTVTTNNTWMWTCMHCSTQHQWQRIFIKNNLNQNLNSVMAFWIFLLRFLWICTTVANGTILTIRLFVQPYPKLYTYGWCSNMKSKSGPIFCSINYWNKLQWQGEESFYFLIQLEMFYKFQLQLHANMSNDKGSL